MPLPTIRGGLALPLAPSGPVSGEPVVQRKPPTPPRPTWTKDVLERVILPKEMSYHRRHVIMSSRIRDAISHCHIADAARRLTRPLAAAS